MIFKGIEICCPFCRGDLEELKQEETNLQCVSCEHRFPMILGIPDLRVFPDPYIEKEQDYEKGMQVAARMEELSLEELVAFYYSITPVVPPKHARQYTNGLMVGVAKAEVTLASCENATVDSEHFAESLLDVGCGTAPLLVAAAPKFTKLVGVDIAFRWLVVAKKRLAEEGLDIPLICACAEALPFPDGAFDMVVADSVIEHVQDQRKALKECHRAMRAGGQLFISTPNRYSLGPDPHAGIWAAGLIPERLIAAYVQRQGGIPPKRRLLSARSLKQLIGEADFCTPDIFLPNISSEQRSQFGMVAQTLINVYQIAKRLPLSRQLLLWIGPVLLAAAKTSRVPPHVLSAGE